MENIYIVRLVKDGIDGAIVGVFRNESDARSECARQNADNFVGCLSEVQRYNVI